MDSERRTQQRIHFPHNHACILKDGRENTIDLTDLSESGAAFRVSSGVLTPGDRGELLFPKMDGSEPTRAAVPGTVRRVESRADTDWVAFEYDSLSSDQAETIRALVAQLK